MLVGKLCPDITMCRSCLEDQMDSDYYVGNCSECTLYDQHCQIISQETGIWGEKYAIVLVNGQIKKVSISRLHDIREV